MADDLPLGNLKDYIVDLRKKGYPNSKIVESLKKVNWPDDVIEAALSDADTVIEPVPEKPEHEPEVDQMFLDKQEKEPGDANEEDTSKEAPADQAEQQPKAGEQKQPEQPKKFTLWAIVALLLSPFPFIGLGVSMTVWDYVRKNKMGGGFLVIIAMLINTAIILLLFWVIYQLFMLGPEKLAGIADFLNDKFNFIPN
jgi:hypothetical protein